MIRLQDSILIQRPAAEVYSLISDLEGHQNLLPGYIESRIIEQIRGGCVLQRKAVIHGKLRNWKSLVHFEPDRALHFEQLEGPLKGMQVHWKLNPVREQTWLEIIHSVHVRPWWKRWWMERVVAKPAIEQTARLVLKAIQQAAEQKVALS